MREEDLISFVIPVYKVEKFLDECLNSVVNQTYTNLDIILVDDGSPDNCPVMCDEWAKKDKRIRVIHKENGGLSSARNAGIRIAKGKYITFIDSDDYVSEVYTEQMYTTLKESGAMMSCCKMSMIIERLNNTVTHDYKIYTPVEALISAVGMRKMEVNAFCKLYHTSIFTQENETFYKEGVLCEDFAVLPAVLFASGKIADTDSILYYYRMREDSIMRTKFTTNYKAYYEAHEIAEDFIRRKHPESWPELSKHYRNDSIQITMAMLRDVCIADNKEDIPYDEIVADLVSRIHIRDIPGFLLGYAYKPKKCMMVLTALFPKLAIKIIERSRNFKTVVK